MGVVLQLQSRYARTWRSSRPNNLLLSLQIKEIQKKAKQLLELAAAPRSHHKITSTSKIPTVVPWSATLSTKSKPQAKKKKKKKNTKNTTPSERCSTSQQRESRRRSPKELCVASQLQATSGQEAERKKKRKCAHCSPRCDPYSVPPDPIKERTTKKKKQTRNTVPRSPLGLNSQQEHAQIPCSQQQQKHNQEQCNSNHGPGRHCSSIAAVPKSSHSQKKPKTVIADRKSETLSRELARLLPPRASNTRRGRGTELLQPQPEDHAHLLLPIFAAHTTHTPYSPASSCNGLRLTSGNLKHNKKRERREREKEGGDSKSLI